MPSDLIVHVIDDDPAARDSLAFLLDCAGRAARTHESADAFLAAAPPLEGACIITDVRMPGMSGVELLRELSQRGARAPVIVITGHADVPMAIAAMKAGAADFIEKPFDDAVILAAIDAAAARLASNGTADAGRAQAIERTAALSPRERDVLRGLVAGRPNKLIAHDLDISPRTVEVYRANLMTKMRAGSLSELIRAAILAGEG